MNNIFHRFLPCRRKNSVLGGLLVLLAFFTLSSYAGTETKKGRASLRSEQKTDWLQEAYFDFEDIPLYEALTSLAAGYHFSFFLDRRVDTEVLVSVSTEPVPLTAALTQLAESAGLEAVPIGSLVYIGPSGSGGELILMIEKHRKSGEGETDFDRLFSLPKESDFISPADVLKSAAKHADYSWSGLDKMPYDCWRADSLPALKTRELFALVLMGYHVDYEVDAEKKKLKPIDLDLTSPITVSWNADDFENVRCEEYPSIEFTPVRKEMRGTGPFQEVARVEYLVSKKRRLRDAEVMNASEPQGWAGTKGGSDAGKLKEISGEVRDLKLRNLSDRLKKELGVEILLDPSLDAAGITYETRVSCKFRDCGPEDAVKIVARQLRVSCRFEGRTAILFRKK